MNVILAWTHEMAIFGWTSRSESEGGSAVFRRQLSFWSQADTDGGWRQFLMKSTSGIKHISEKLNLFGTVFDPIFVFLGPGPPSQWWYWRERYTDTFIAKGGGHV